MKIVINDEDFEALPYDDPQSLLLRYAAGKKKDYRFLRFDQEDFDITSSTVLKTRDLKKKIKKASTLSSIFDDDLKKYSLISPREVIAQWLHVNGKVDNKGKVDVNTATLDEIKRRQPSLDTLSKLDLLVSDEKKRNEQINFQVERFIKAENKARKIISTLEPVKTNPFELEEVILNIKIHFPEGENLLDIFDAIEVSEKIPFVILAYRHRLYYKVYKHLKLPMSWIDAALPPRVNAIYFKLLNVPVSRLGSRTLLFENLYADGMWTSTTEFASTITVDFKIRQTNMKELILSAIGDRLRYEVVETQQAGIKGYFSLDNFKLDPVIFADLIEKDELYRYFCFVNEREKTSLIKPRFFVYITPGEEHDIDASLGVTFVPTPDLSKLNIRITRARTLRQALSTQIIITYLLAQYNEKAESIKKIYKSIIGSELFDRAQPKVAAKEDKKTGRRVKALRDVDADLFRTRYPDQCQREKHPYHIKPDEVNKLVKRLGGDAHKVMLFEGHHYACDPRETDDKITDPEHLWPGLKRNTKGDKDFITKHPLLPCCYTVDQYTKKSSELRKYVDRKKGGGDEDSKKPTAPAERGLTYIVSSHNRVDEGRFGEMPYNWNKLLNLLNFQRVTRMKQNFYPIVRKGVKLSPDSFIHCLRQAFSDKDEVSEIRRKWAAMDLTVTRQETVGITTHALVEMLNDNTRYVDPDLFISLAKEYYECNILLFLLDSKHPFGEIVIPRHQRAYLHQELNRLLPTVLILKYGDIENEDFPYQCELITEVEIESNKLVKVNSLFVFSPLIDACFSLFVETNDVIEVKIDD